MGVEILESEVFRDTLTFNGIKFQVILIKYYIKISIENLNFILLSKSENYS